MLKVLVLICLIFVMADGSTESVEDTQPYSNRFYAPSTLNFHDIYKNNVLGTATEEESTSTTEDSTRVQPQLVEFHPDTMTKPPSTVPPPIYILNSSYIEDPTIQPTTSTEDPEEIKVIPIKNRDYQRGVLDLLFPSSRVKSFKNIFDSFRKMLSHTFRRR